MSSINEIFQENIGEYDLCDNFAESSDRKRLCESFFQAFYEYEYETLSELIQCIGTPDIPNENGETPLYSASINGCSYELDRQMAKFLMDQGADVLYPCGQSTPAAFLVQYDDQAIIDFILLKIDVNTPLDSSYNTALHLAVKSCKETTVRKLLESGANPNLSNSKHKTAIHEAVTPKGCDLIEMLVQYGADINARSYLRMTPMHLAAISKNGRILEKVLRCKPDVNARTSDRNTALALYLIHNENIDMKQLSDYIEAGTDCALFDQHGMNVLHRIVTSPFVPDMEKVVTNLLNLGVSIDSKTSGDGNTALHLAANQNVQITDILLSKGANILLKNSRGRTALDNALFGAKLAVIEMIVTFIVRQNRPIGDFMLRYHQTTDIFDSLSNIYRSCLEEFQRIKTMKVLRGVSYSDLLHFSERKFAKLLRNKEISLQIEENINCFSAFKKSFRSAYLKAKMRRYAEDETINFLFEAMHYKLPLLCIERIVSELHTKELYHHS